MYIEEEKLNEIVKSSIETKNENVMLKLDYLKLQTEMAQVLKAKQMQDVILNQYSEYNKNLAKEIEKLKSYITENFEEFSPKKDDVDLEKDLENLSNREDLSASFVGSNGKLYSAKSIFDVSIILLKKLKKLKDMGYESFLSSDDILGDDSEV